MGKIVDSTSVVDCYNSITQTPKNFNEKNYWLKELQDKVDYDWDYRPNRVDIEQETGFGNEEFEPIEVVIQSVRNDSGEKVSDDWRRLVFKNILEKRRIGQRYRFSYDFDLEQPNDEKSIWLAVNQDAASPTAQQVIVRCNGTIASIYIDEKGIKHLHYEPVVQTENLQGAGTDFSKVAIDPNGKITITTQYNKYTNQYYINQRFIIGTDQVYKVQNVIKNGSLSTYKPNDVGVMKMYLQVDQIGAKDNFDTRLAYNGRDDENNIVEPDKKEDEGTEKSYRLRVEPEPQPSELLSTPVEFVAALLENEVVVKTAVEVKCELEGGTTVPQNYYELKMGEELNTFSLRRKKFYAKGDLLVSCFVPEGSSPTGEKIEYNFKMSMRGLE